MLMNSYTNAGFNIEEAYNFSKQLSNYSKDENELLNELIELRSKANINDIIGSFSKRVLNNFDNIKEIVNYDNYAHLSDANNLDKFYANFEHLENLFSKYRRLQQAELDYLNIKQEEIQIKKELYELDKQNIGPEEKNAKAVELHKKLPSNSAKYRAYDEFVKLESEYNKYNTNLNVVDFKNDLLKTIAAIEDDYKLLAIAADNKEKIQGIINDTREEVIKFALDNIKAKTELDKLCNRYGITYNSDLNDMRQASDEPSKTNNMGNGQKDNTSNKGNNANQTNNETSKTNSTKPSKDASNTPSVNSKLSFNRDDYPGYQGTVHPDEQIAPYQSSVPNSPNNTPPQQDLSAPPLDFNLEEPKIKVVGRRACNWVNKHKKEILIAVGISLLIVATVVAMQYLIPAVVHMIETQQIAALSSAMVNNAEAWHLVGANQAALHSANNALGAMIQSITNSKAVFDAASGVWTFGGTQLSQFAATAAANASVAAEAVSSLSSVATTLGVGGLGITGLGAFLSKRSDAYYKVLNTIKELEASIKKVPAELIATKANEILNVINNSSELSVKEKNRLFKRINKLMDKLKIKDLKSEKKQEELEELENVLQGEESKGLER